jgi:hypothetical protein
VVGEDAVVVVAAVVAAVVVFDKEGARPISI